ncbi:uncharacterized protein GGS25DRAFT_498480 [Hypoxylon fragiforme]|uniref:uncharacterized protein n=1 Tax=Hypoxylon fragiforme TaxID=63214 RepID=UPI0020C657E9|nr:uncharacterized protein GGS25DRAFT_498480 [Hypoxylon fragiforme]KAI2605885.1 hypothetical protein GGS25DRAFT_498480 [Hypoxylon fragiforme]
MYLFYSLIFLFGLPCFSIDLFVVAVVSPPKSSMCVGTYCLLLTRKCRKICYVHVGRDDNGRRWLGLSLVKY